MARTYIPGLRLAAGGFDRYAKRWSTKLQLTLEPAQYAALLEAITKVDALIISLGEPELLP